MTTMPASLFSCDDHSRSSISISVPLSSQVGGKKTKKGSYSRGERVNSNHFVGIDTPPYAVDEDLESKQVIVATLREA